MALSEHPISQDNARRASGTDERTWLKWVADAEVLLGHEIDPSGDAYDAWANGDLPFTYAATVWVRL